MSYTPATPEDAQRLTQMLEQHLEESHLNLTIDELILSVNVILPTRDENGTIQGFIAYDEVETLQYGKVASWRILYTDPSVRKNFKTILKDMLDFFKSHGYAYVETQCNYKVDNFYQRKLKSRPIQYVHFGKIDDMLGRL